MAEGQRWRFRAKPDEIEAVRWTGGNLDEVAGFILADGFGPESIIPRHDGRLVIDMQEDRRAVSLGRGDYLVRLSSGLLTVFDGECFTRTHEPVP